MIGEVEARNLANLLARSEKARQQAERYAAVEPLYQAAAAAMGAELVAFEGRVKRAQQALAAAAEHAEHLRAEVARFERERDEAQREARALVAGWTGEITMARALAAQDRLTVAELNYSGASAALERARAAVEGAAGLASLTRWLSDRLDAGKRETSAILAALRGAAQGPGYARGLAASQGDRMTAAELGYALVTEPHLLAVAGTKNGPDSISDADAAAVVEALASNTLHEGRTREAREEIAVLVEAFRLRAQRVNARVKREAALLAGAA